MNSLSADVPCWKVAEIDLTSQRVYDNPYQAVTITAAFAGPQGQCIVREAFWCGQNLWKVRFAPTAAGRWTWKTACSDITNAALHKQSGELRCVAYSGENPVYRHGFLRVSDNRRCFCHADGKPFLALRKGCGMFRQSRQQRIGCCVWRNGRKTGIRKDKCGTGQLTKERN